MSVPSRVTRTVLLLGLVAVIAVSAVGLVHLAGGRPGPASAAPRWVEAVVSAVPAPPASPSVAPSPLAAPLLVPLLRPGVVRISTPGFWSWALLETGTGVLSGAVNMTATSTTASMIKAWIAADYLRRTAERGTTPPVYRLAEVSTMIRDSDNNAAVDLYAVVGHDASIRRLVALCRLTETRPFGTSWSKVTVSARDTARLAGCIADGRAAGPTWTAWLLNEMRLVRGDGDFGIRKALPAEVAARTPIKNGWLARADDKHWHIACLAIGEGWTLGVLARYPEDLGKEHGMRICQSVAAQLLVPA